MTQSRHVKTMLLYAFSGFFGFLFLLMPVLLYLQRAYIRNLIKFTEISCLFMQDLINGIVKIPFLISFIMSFFIMLWLAVALYLFSVGSTLENGHLLPYDQFQYSAISFGLSGIHIWELFWVTSILLGSCEYLLQAMFIRKYELYIVKGKAHKYDIYEQVFN